MYKNHYYHEQLFVHIHFGSAVSEETVWSVDHKLSHCRVCQPKPEIVFQGKTNLFWLNEEKKSTKTSNYLTCFLPTKKVA